MKGMDILVGIFIFLMIIGIGFTLLYLFDTFVYEPFFSTPVIDSNMSPSLYWLMGVSVSFGFPIVLFGGAFLQSIKSDRGY